MGRIASVASAAANNGEQQQEQHQQEQQQQQQEEEAAVVVAATAFTLRAAQPRGTPHHLPAQRHTRTAHGAGAMV
ncbi:unnamed protein product [Lampetra planeri]